MAATHRYNKEKWIRLPNPTMGKPFSGQYFDAETGLHYNFHRDYEKETGRYVESDPIGIDGGIHLFSFAGQNPVNFIDMDGLIYVKPPDTPTHQHLERHIICDGDGGFTVKNITPDAKGRGKGDECGISDCGYEHEDDHIMALRFMHPYLCKCQPYGAAPAYGDPYSYFFYNDDDPWTALERDAYEIPACQVEHKCLKKREKMYSYSDPCWIKIAIKIFDLERNPYCGN